MGMLVKNSSRYVGVPDSHFRGTAFLRVILLGCSNYPVLQAEWMILSSFFQCRWRSLLFETRAAEMVKPFQKPRQGIRMTCGLFPSMEGEELFGMNRN